MGLASKSQLGSTGLGCHEEPFFALGNHPKAVLQVQRLGFGVDSKYAQPNTLSGVLGLCEDALQQLGSRPCKIHLAPPDRSLRVGMMRAVGNQRVRGAFHDAI
jgi:hypothetical protein